MNYRRLVVMILGAVMLVLAGCAGLGSTASGGQPAPSAQTSTAPSQAQVVQVSISDSGISADPSTLSAGTLYHFAVTNTGRATYQFVMGLVGGWGCCHMPRGWRQQMTVYRSASIAPGATQTFDYTLPASAVGQRFGFGCYQQGEQAGMWYPATVQRIP